MTYSPTDRLHRHFRFPQVLRYSLGFDSDSLATPIYVHRQCKSGYNQDGWFTRLFAKARNISELVLLSHKLEALYIKTLPRNCQPGLGFHEAWVRKRERTKSAVPTPTPRVYGARLPAKILNQL
jgi:hypothetical protein